MSKLKGKVKAKARKKNKNNKKVLKENYKKRMLSFLKKYDDDFLSKKCKVVEEFDKKIEKDISLMKKVLGLTKNGAGLAAPQIGIDKRIIVFKTDPDKYDTETMINPEIVSHSLDKKYGVEMCLSYPNIKGYVERFSSIEVRY